MTAINQSSTYIYLAIAADPDTTTPTVENSFDVVTYTGNGSSQDIETDFKPDLVWVKIRTQAYAHNWMDSIRGVNKQIRSSGTNAEITNATLITSFNDNGFTVGTGSDSNKSGDDFVAWCWKAGDHDDNLPEINTEGTIDSIVSVNDAAGFSIVKYTSTGTNGSTIGHGLSGAPDLIIIKSVSNTSNWIVYASSLGTGKYLYLNGSGNAQSASWINTSATTFTLNNTYQDANTNGRTYIAYCWYSVSGHSSIGSYTGDGTTTKAINVGFKPRFLLIKITSASDNWVIFDSQRDPSDPRNTNLKPNSSAAETDEAGSQVNFTSTGFTCVGSGAGLGQVNSNGGTYIYIAFK